MRFSLALLLGSTMLFSSTHQQVQSLKMDCPVKLPKNYIDLEPVDMLTTTFPSVCPANRSCDCYMSYWNSDSPVPLSRKSTIGVQIQCAISAGRFMDTIYYIRKCIPPEGYNSCSCSMISKPLKPQKDENQNDSKDQKDSHDQNDSNQ